MDIHHLWDVQRGSQSLLSESWTVAWKHAIEQCAGHVVVEVEGRIDRANRLDEVIAGIIGDWDW